MHLAAPAPLEESLERMKKTAATVVSPIVSIPPGRFAYCLDPDGNTSASSCTTEKEPMRRADRLFQIVQHLRGGRLVTARMLSERLEVSESTVYRDVADLMASGVPIDGEAGVGYILRSGFDLPPLMFTRDELAALTLGARFVKAWGGAALALAAEEALVKIEAVMPEKDKRAVAETNLFAMGYSLPDEVRRVVDHLDASIREQAPRAHCL